ncbi:MAG: tetratricopeptide repeat protein [Deltaproteobacteria bacterium]|nr:tetratricopeptide repeat protein [Deltaproteobacteria bacterium]
MVNSKILAKRSVGLMVACSLVGCAGGLSEEVKGLKSQLSEIRSIQAEHTASINEMRQQIGQLGGQVEEAQHLAKGKTEELQRTLEQVSSRVPPPPGVPEDLLNSDDEAISRINSDAATEYRQSLQFLRAGNFDRALTGFTNFIAQNPGTAFTDSALFWSGVCYEKMNQLDRAIGAYSDVFQRFPAEDFVPPSLYRLGDTFEKMGSSKEASFAFQKLVDEHPRSNEAQRARERLAPKGGKRTKR